MHPSHEQRREREADQRRHDRADRDLAEHVAVEMDGLDRRRQTCAAPSSARTPVSCAISPARYCENAVARNQPPITVLTIRAGESRVTIERPTGETHSSPVVCSR